MRFPGAESEVLSGLNVTFEPGSTTALIGSTGAGKTTFVNLLMRFYEIDGGAIRVEGVDTEHLVQRAMENLQEGLPAFIIAHRLSTIRDADLIVVMEAGAVVEQGTHRELLQAGGPFQRLYRTQFEAPQEDPSTDLAS